MKAKVYLRMAATSRSFKYAATSKPSDQPLYDQHGRALPTIAFALVLSLPGGAFQIPTVGEVEIPLDAIQPVVEIELS
jgi:hypothetical protein